MDGDLLKAIQITALHEIDQGSSEQWYKSLCRWYSHEFHTPLPQVEEMSPEEVFRVYFEDSLYNLKHSDNERAEQVWNEFKAKAITPREVLDQIEQDADDWAAEMTEKVQRDEEKKRKQNEALTAKKDSKKEVETPEIPNLIDIEDKFELSGEDLNEIPSE